MSTVRLAATLMLARPAATGFEIYMTRRSAASPFAPDAFVFPGGTVDAQDRSEEAQTRTLGLEPQLVREQFRARIPEELPTTEEPVDTPSASALLVAALREAFEEAGLLIAHTADAALVDASHVRSAGVARQRTEVHAGTLTFADFLRVHDWYADARGLRLFSHWITPPSEPRRYNTHFFFASAPFDQIADADAFETHDGIWIAPLDALERYRTGRFHLVYPTIKHLERLVSFDSIDAVLDFARDKPIVTIMPNTAGERFAIPPALEGRW